MQEYDSKEPEPVARSGQEKRCSGPCGLLLPLEAFGRHKKAKDGLNWWCKACNRASAQAHYAAHRAEKIAYQRAYYAAHRETINAAQRQERHLLRERDPRAWQAANKAHYKRYGEQSAPRAKLWQAQHPERMRSIRKKSYRRHRGQHDVGVHRRGVRVRAIAGYTTRRQIALLYDVQRGRCAYCLGDLSGGYVRDHMIPIVRHGSSNWVHNICLACRWCNGRKHARDAGQFFALLIKERRAQVTV